VAVLVRVSSAAHPDETQFDPTSDYFDAKATRETRCWMCVDVTFVEKTRLVSIAEMRTEKAPAGMLTLQRGNRLSITPVTDAEWKIVAKLAGVKAARRGLPWSERVTDSRMSLSSARTRGPGDVPASTPGLPARPGGRAERSASRVGGVP